MALLDKIRGKKEEDKKKSPKKEENVLELAHDHGHDHVQAALKENTGTAHRILKHYHLSEKTNLFSNSGRYVFMIDKHANKIEVKKAVEKVYDVHVSKVNIVNVSGKARRYGRSVGTTSDWKKAIVTLKEGERITGLAEGV